MDEMHRYAVYYAPRPGAFADTAAAWLSGEAMVANLPVSPGEITAEPRRYGFHGTLRAPFRPGAGVDQATVSAAVAALAGGLAPVRCDGLRLENLHGFLALTATGGEAELAALGAAVVAGTDGLRARLSEADIARRRPDSLSVRQRELLYRWGYPFVMEEFRFHLTLTDRLPADLAGPVAGALAVHFKPVLPKPFVIEELCLFGQDAGGAFHLLHRYALAG